MSERDNPARVEARVPLHTPFSHELGFIKLELSGMRSSILQSFELEYVPELRLAIESATAEAIKSFEVVPFASALVSKTIRELVGEAVNEVLKEIAPEIKAAIAKVARAEVEKQMPELAKAAAAAAVRGMARGYL